MEALEEPPRPLLQLLPMASVFCWSWRSRFFICCGRCRSLCFSRIGRKGTGPCVKPVAPKSSKVIASSSSSENYRRGKLRPKTIVHSIPAPKQGVTTKQLRGLTAVRVFTLNKLSQLYIAAARACEPIRTRNFLKKKRGASHL